MYSRHVRGSRRIPLSSMRATVMMIRKNWMNTRLSTPKKLTRPWWASAAAAAAAM
jgi:hypothetical protein